MNKNTKAWNNDMWQLPSYAVRSTQQRVATTILLTIVACAFMNHMALLLSFMPQDFEVSFKMLCS